MNRFIVAVCLLAHSACSLPQRGVQLGGSPRPVTLASQQGSQNNFGPTYSQQITFGPNDAGLRAASPYRSPQPIVLQQGSPTAAPSAFASFPSRGSPVRALPVASQPSDDEYEEYEDEEETPKPQVTARPVQRVPVRVSQPIAFSQGPQRLVIPQNQPQQVQAPVRQRQPVPQRQSFVSQPVQQYSPQPQPQRVQQSSPQQSRQQQAPSFGIDGKRSRFTTPAPVQTLNRYMRQNDDGSVTWGYENEDGTFKEETIGTDCVVRGKYGYVDPEGQKREYEYQTGNPCDPNKKDQEEEEEEERQGPGQNQQIQGIIHARPRVQQQQRRPVALQPQYVQQQ